MGDGSLEVVCELPVDVNTMAIDTEGNFYSAGYASNILYTYTLADVTAENPGMTTIGEMGYYYSTQLSSMAWDHNTGKLYWAFPNTLLEIDPKTAVTTLLGYHTELLVGLYTCPAYDEGRFDPVDTVSAVELSHSDTRVLKGSSYALEATVWPWNASDRIVTWTSSDETVATVDADGVVTGISEGTCVITATSNLDGTVSASCAIEVFRMEKTLNGLVWDENGEIWMSEFSTTIPKYTKLSSKGLGKDLASATVGQDGNIYAASLETGTLKSELYKLDPVTYQPTLIGPSSDGYVDLAPAPGQPGNSLMAVWGGNVMNVNADTGDYYNWYYMFSYNLVALSYVGTDYDYTDWGYDTQVDWYFIIDRVGYVYLMGFMEQNGRYYYLEHDQLAPGGIYTKLDFEMDTPYFGSAYFDGEFLYYSAYKESRNNVTLMAIDVAGGSKACYELGTFADNIWPVAGVMELGKADNNIGIIHSTKTVETMSRPKPVEQTELKGIREEKAEGGLNAAAMPVQPVSKGAVGEDAVSITVTVPTEAFEPTNGTLWVEFDPAALELERVEGQTRAFAWKLVEEGKVAIAYAAREALANDSAIAVLDFNALTEGETEVSVVWDEYGEQYLDLVEQISVTLPCPSERFVDVNEGDWWHEATDYVVEKGYMNGMDATHFGPALTMNRAQFVTVLYRMENSPAITSTGVFTDVPAGEFYTDAAYWALSTGITTGATLTTFNPEGKLTRMELVTFMYRYAAYKGYDTTATADLSGYRDADEILAFAVEPWRWSVTQGIVSGMTENTLAPMNLTNRAQAAVIFQRFDSRLAN